jgi:hypothetical protein
MDWLFAGIDQSMKFDPRADYEGCIMSEVEGSRKSFVLPDQWD